MVTLHTEVDYLKDMEGTLIFQSVFRVTKFPHISFKIFNECRPYYIFVLSNVH